MVYINVNLSSLNHYLRVFTLTMSLNPILMLFFAGLSFVVGAAILNDTENWLSGLPFVVFISLFFLSLLVPDIKKTQAVDGYRGALKTLRQAIKSTAEWLSAFAHHGARHLAQKRSEMDRAHHPKSILGN